MKFGWNLRAMTFGWAITGSGVYSCSTKQIIAAYKARLSAAGVTVGSTKCLSNYVNNLTGTSKADCITTAYKLRLQALGVVTGPTTCLTNYVKNLTGEPRTYVVATCDTMNTTCDNINYLSNEEWYNLT
jgi:hypothetical protein